MGDVVEDTDLRSPRHNKAPELGSAAGGNANQLNRSLSLMVNKEMFFSETEHSYFRLFLLIYQQDDEKHSYRVESSCSFMHM